MRDSERHDKHLAITAAAYEMLAARGYDGTSMLSIAKAAKASNETLYRWYGDKRGLIAAMVRDNAAAIRTALTEAIAKGDDPAATLQQIGPLLLRMLLGERAIILNRAAAADPTGELGAAIAAGGRDVIRPLITRLIGAAGHQEAPDRLADWYLGLLIGDLQIRRVIGVMPPPTAAQIADRCDAAHGAFLTLLRET